MHEMWKGGERMSDLEKCEHEWAQINLASIKFALSDTENVLYLAKARYCIKCKMFMGFNLVDHSELVQ